jgi:hypothetical protein
MKEYRIEIVVILMLFSVFAGSAMAQKTSLEEQFRNPVSEEASPWSFWYWMYGAVSKKAITADLEAMNEIGLGGAYLMPIRSPSDNTSFVYSPAYEQLTPEWWELVRFSMEEADRLKLKLGMHICDGFALAGGPWITPEKSMQKVVWSDTVISGGEIKCLRLPRPKTFENFYHEIALYAFPVADFFTTDCCIPHVNSSTEDRFPAYLVDRSASGTFRSSSPCWIQYTFEGPFTCRSIKIVPDGNNYQAQRLCVYASDNGVEFKKIKQLVPPQHGWQNTDENFTYSIPATTARYFRFYWDPAGSEPGAEDLDAAKWKPILKINKIFLSSEALIDQLEGKNGSVWRVSKRTPVEELPDEDCVKLSQIIRLDPCSLNGDELNVVLPPGRWKIVRMGHTSTGHRNETGGTGKGLECDKFSKEAVKLQFENWFGAAFRKTDPVLARRVLKFLHVDSWECGCQNWSDNFLDEFEKRRGYDLSPYLLVYAGIPLESVEQTESILYDIRQTIAELVVDVFYQTLAEFSGTYGCKFSAECVAPTMVSDGMLHYRMVDRPMGEFWLQSPTHDKFNDMLDAISGAHVYGKNIIQAEGFTQLRIMWNENPRMLKPLLDLNFALGMNKLFHHVYVHNPYFNKAPGVTLDGIGLYFQRDQLWWRYAKAWVDYIGRCQTLLQFGRPVVDIAVFTGEEIPRRAILPDRLVNSLPGIFGEERVQTEKKRLANEGQPLRTMPVGVTHSANLTDASDWIDALNGYIYDSFNRDALLRLADVKDGRLVLPGGMSYKILVLPKPHPMSPESRYMSKEVAEKIREFQQKGLVVLLGDKPELVPGFYKKNQFSEALKEIAEEIWSISSQYLLPYQHEDFSQFGLEKDIDFNGEKDIAWTHRAEENTDIYFIANQQEEERHVCISFRCSDRIPELWDPVTGKITEAQEWSIHNRRTHVKLNLHKSQSVFVVFRKPTTIKSSKKSFSLPKRRVLSDCEWRISFGEDSSENLISSQLFDWSENESNTIRYYAGEAIYETHFTWDNDFSNDAVYLHLGEVNVMAEVFLNDTNCGIVWTSPTHVNIAKAMKKGNNKLQIRVVNTWANKIKGVYEKHIVDDNVWTNAPYYLGGQSLQPSGLLGPITIEYFE